MPALTAVSLALLMGCGGHHHDGSDCTGQVTANAAYAGDYTITYTPDAGSSAPTLTFHATVSGVTGVVGYIDGSGSGSDGSTLTIGANNGYPSFAGDDDDCEHKAYVKLDYRLSSADPNTTAATEILVSKKIDGTILGSYKASALIGSTSLSSGTLTIVPATPVQ